MCLARPVGHGHLREFWPDPQLYGRCDGCLRMVLPTSRKMQGERERFLRLFDLLPFPGLSLYSYLSLVFRLPLHLMIHYTHYGESGTVHVGRYQNSGAASGTLDINILNQMGRCLVLSQIKWDTLQVFTSVILRGSLKVVFLIWGIGKLKWYSFESLFVQISSIVG